MNVQVDFQNCTSVTFMEYVSTTYMTIDQALYNGHKLKNY